MVRIGLTLLALTGLLACTDVPPPPSGPSGVTTGAPTGAPRELRTLAEAKRAFVAVAQSVEPVAERECRARTRGVNCDFRIAVDDRRGQPPNAFQTLQENGRPLIVFTLALIDDARNADELAFVMSHEAAHHIRGHIDKQQQFAILGAEIFGGIATVTGGTQADVERAQQIGASVGARSYSKEFELEADALGTIITDKAGYSPLVGAEFFNRIPDPGNQFLGTHPPNAERKATVARVAASL